MKEARMLRTASHLKGASIAATDGEIGSVQDLYFDDSTWTVRYLVVDTGTWLPGRQVLISPRSLRPMTDDDRIPVALSKAQVEKSPSIELDRSVDRQYEEEYSQYYGYPFYWSGPYRWGASPYPGEGPLSTSRAMSAMPPSGDPSLRSARNVMGYYIEATDGDIGHVEDFLIDDQEWAIRYMIVDTRNWWPGKKVVISPEWITRVSWPDSRVYVEMTKGGIKAAPEYDPNRPMKREYESRLFSHHGRRTYWD
jgi:sporulation protein YlmC with PRC-barrel domain